MQYEFRKLDDDTVAQLIALSREWEAENCTHGLTANTRADLKEPLAVALDGGKIVGYIFGGFYQMERRTSYAQAGDPCFAVEELYVLPQYRSRGIGKALFHMMEEYVGDKCRFLTLSTATKNYKAILNLYVEELGMTFHSAYLIKEMGT